MNHIFLLDRDDSTTQRPLTSQDSNKRLTSPSGLTEFKANGPFHQNRLLHFLFRHSGLPLICNFSNLLSISLWVCKNIPSLFKNGIIIWKKRIIYVL